MDYLSKDVTNKCKGILAICILFHHIYQYGGGIQGCMFSVLLQAMGFLCVGMFFFYSGYGLMISVQKKDYLQNFLRKRIFPIYLSYICLIIMYYVWLKFCKIEVTNTDLILSFFIGKTIVPLAWYIQVLLLLYIIYYILFNVVKNNDIRIICMIILVTIVIIVFYLVNFSSTWYETLYCFVLGMVWCYKRHTIDKILEEKKWKMEVGILFLFLSSIILSRYNVLIKMISAVLFVMVFNIATKKIMNTWLMKNRINEYIGKYSYEIYTTQGLFLLLRKSPMIQISTVFFVILTFCGTLSIAPLFYKMNEYIRKKCL